MVRGDPEIIDPDTGEVLPDGEEGELVITSLTKEALPVIRYRTRDLTRLLPGTARTMRRIQRIKGRSDDMLIIRGVNVYPSQVEVELLKVDELAPHYQLEVVKAGNTSGLVVNVESSEKLGEASSAAAATEACMHIKSEHRDHGGCAGPSSWHRRAIYGQGTEGHRLSELTT